MRLEDLIYSRLLAAEPLTGLLARFDGSPAVFYQAAPEDTAGEWEGAKYPRIDYTVDLQANPERQTSGVLMLHIWCEESGMPPEDIEPAVKGALCDVFIRPTEPDMTPYAMAWVRSDAFTSSSAVKPETKVIGVSLTFDVFAFPVHESIDPDPILAMNRYADELGDPLAVIGRYDLPEFFTPTMQRPAVYFRLQSTRVYQETNTVIWLDGVVVGHVFAPTANDRLMWLRYFANTLAARGEVTMLDTSPMFLRGIQINAGADPLAVGQLRMDVRFGILRRPAYAHTLLEFTQGR